MIEALRIRNVHQTSVFLPERFNVYFTINSQKYMLAVTKNDQDVFVPRVVFHETADHDQCPFCQNVWFGSHCEMLNDQIKPLFHHLIEFPSIRLEWLFLNHA